MDKSTEPTHVYRLIDDAIGQGVQYDEILAILKERGFDEAKIEDLVIQRIQLRAELLTYNSDEKTSKRKDKIPLVLPQRKRRISWNNLSARLYRAIVFFVMAGGAFIFALIIQDVKFIALSMGLIAFGVASLLFDYRGR